MYTCTVPSHPSLPSEPSRSQPSYRTRIPWNSIHCFQIRTSQRTCSLYFQIRRYKWHHPWHRQQPYPKTWTYTCTVPLHPSLPSEQSPFQPSCHTRIPWSSNPYLQTRTSRRTCSLHLRIRRYKLHYPWHRQFPYPKTWTYTCTVPLHPSLPSEQSPFLPLCRNRIP